MDDNTNNNTGMNINDLNGVPPVGNDYNSLQPTPAVDMNNMQTPAENTPPVEEVDLNSIPGVTDVPPVVESPQPTESITPDTIDTNTVPSSPLMGESITPDVAATPQPTESITPDTIDMNTVSSTPLESNEVTPPPVASMDTAPQNLSEPLPSVAPTTADVLPAQGNMDVVNTLEQQPESGKGGSAVVIVLIVIIVALLATIGYFAVQIFF